MKIVLVAIVALGLAACGSSNETPSSTPTAPRNYTVQIDNEWFPLPVGRTLRYAGSRDGKAAREVLTVTNKTRTIDGVETRVVRDRLWLDGALAETTRDYYVQDGKGNVWYYGEDTAELDQAGKVTSTEGTWHAGADGATPGIIMEASPRLGKAIRQEYLKGHAEDWFKVLSLDATATVPAGTYAPSLQTQEWTPLEPGVLSDKYYAKGIGIVREIDVKGGNEELELVKVR
jgi:hypothetical protein